jgi:acetyl-CoA synthetase
MVSAQEIISCGLTPLAAETLSNEINTCLTTLPADQAWQKISKHILQPHHPLKLHTYLFSQIFPNWHADPASAPAWIPDDQLIKESNLHRLMTELAITSVANFRSWASTQYADFWRCMIRKIGIVFKKPCSEICDLSNGVESPDWLPNAKFNISDSCFTAAGNSPAMIFYNHQQVLQTMSYGELNHVASCIANSLLNNQFLAGDAIAIAMPMTVEAIAIYLGIIKMGGVVVSIADSFSSEEMATRLRLSNAKGIFTQDYILRGDKKIPLYAKVTAANAPKAIIFPCEKTVTEALREPDLTWQTFLSDIPLAESYPCDPQSSCNILFSSGTTGDPKAIPWIHTTPIKCASDAYLHQNIQPGDVLAWPTNLGWMMGPWLIFAALINKATIAIYPDVARDRAYGEFVQNAKVTMLGVVPTLVAAWRQSHCMEGLDWQQIKAFSSTGECSNADDMFYLMALAGYKPVIEYCGGTEIGGSYLTSTVIENNYPAVFTTAAFGLDLVLLDEDGNLTNNGEVALIPPSIGLSTILLNAKHHDVYFANMPTLVGKILRRHGDQARRLQNGYYCILGRMDDTMNLGGIKVSSAEIERALIGINAITETAAIAISPPNGGPSQLVIYATTTNNLNKEKMLKEMQTRINQHLNPLFKIHDVVFTNELPKTASNKIMRRVLRKNYYAIVE